MHYGIVRNNIVYQFMYYICYYFYIIIYLVTIRFTQCPTPRRFQSFLNLQINIKPQSVFDLPTYTYYYVWTIDRRSIYSDIKLCTHNGQKIKTDFLKNLQSLCYHVYSIQALRFCAYLFIIKIICILQKIFSIIRHRTFKIKKKKIVLMREIL